METALSAASMKFELPAAAAALGGTVAGQPAVATAGGLAFAMVGLGHSWKQGWADRRAASPESYLLRGGKGLRPRSLLARVLAPGRHEGRAQGDSASERGGLHLRVVSADRIPRERYS